MLTVHLFKNGVEGGLKTFDGSVTPKAVAQSIGPRLAKDAIAAKVGDKVVGVDFALPAEGDVNLTIFTKSDPEALAVMRHSCAHVMARAIMRLFPGVQLAFGPTTENGFYYDVLAPTPISEEDFPKIEAEMAKIIQKDEAFERFEDSREDALTLATEMNQKFKVEHINDGLKEYPTLSFYRQGEFIDLCRGPHVPSAGAIGA
ncbi:MAG TPA: TGS domain-containing protein, partial [Pirellulales bacterium]